MSDNYEFLNDLNDKQKNVCTSDNNFILTACPGSGKTRTITYRLAYLSTKYQNSNLLNIAITYTNRAAEEIEKRLLNMDIRMQNIWSGTIHQFCMKFILRPYSMYHSKLSKGYIIIDEYTKEKYVKQIAEDKGIEGYINTLYDNTVVMSSYYEYIENRREIDFDKILEYSLELVEEKIFVATNIASLIRSIHVDEYQDTNEKQYLILSKLIRANSKINILFVGDVNQAIYRGLGGVAKTANEIEKLFSVKFNECCLDGCYRSTQRLVDYYINYEVSETGVSSVAEIQNYRGIIAYESGVHKDLLAKSISDIVKSEIENGVPEYEICIVAPQWYQIFPLANKFRELLPNYNFDAPDITPIKYDPLNVFFLIAKLLYMEQYGHQFKRRKIANEIITIINEDYDLATEENIGSMEVLKAINSTVFIDEDGIQTLKNAIKNVFNIMNIKMNNELKIVYEEFFKKIDSRIKKYELEYTCEAIVKNFREKSGIVISTIHGVKGEEYITVIAFDLLNGHLPNWNYIFDSEMKKSRVEETNKLLYVLCSRAKKNLYLFSEKGRKTNNGNFYNPTDELSQCIFDYD